MAGWNHDNANWSTKSCLSCSTEFTPKSGAQQFCSTQCRSKFSKACGAGSTEAQYAAITGNWDRYFSRLIAHQGKKNQELRRNSVTKGFLLGLYKRQRGLCALTGVTLTCSLVRGTRVWTNASIDRINPGVPYSDLSNLRLVCAAVNLFKYSLTEEEYVWWCTRVALTNPAAAQAFHGYSTIPAEGEKEHGHG